MEVRLASCGNPDHFQDPDQPMYGCEPDHYLTVNSLEEASAECLRFIKRNFLGGGNWIGGDVYENGKSIAKIAFNGRIIPEHEYKNRKKSCDEHTIDVSDLVAHGIGDVPVWLAEDGLVQAVLYFYDNDLQPRKCFEANQSGTDIELADHWNKAQKMANQVLAGDSRYDNSMIILDYDVF